MAGKNGLHLQLLESHESKNAAFFCFDLDRMLMKKQFIIAFVSKLVDTLSEVWIMNYFLKLNTASLLYALMAVIPLELMLNVYRISRLTGWEIGTVNMWSGIINLVILIGGTTLLYRLTQNWLDCRKLNYLTAILWFPYFIIFVFTFASLFPITYGGDDPNPVTGLLMIFGIPVYPFLILILNNLSMMSCKDSDDNLKSI